MEGNDKNRKKNTSPLVSVLYARTKGKEEKRRKSACKPVLQTARGGRGEGRGEGEGKRKKKSDHYESCVEENPSRET